LAYTKTKNFDTSFKALIDETAVADLFMGITIPVLQELIQTEGQAQAERLNTTDPFNPNNATIQDRVKTMLKMTAQSYTSTTLKLLNNSLGEGVANGESLAKLTNRVADVFDLTSKYRAEQVARTSVFATANASAREAYRQSGVVSEVKWHTAEDEIVCEFCGPMNGKTVGIDESYFDDGELVQGADGGTLQLAFGDVIDPPLHVNCRCFTNAVVSRKDNHNTDTEEKEIDDDVEFLETVIGVLQ
jgi:SPP1 gp7 family putative phage head morphogenesis protein